MPGGSTKVQGEGYQGQSNQGQGNQGQKQAQVPPNSLGACYFLGGPNQKTFLLQNVALDPRIPKIYNTFGLWWVVLEQWLSMDRHTDTQTDTQCHLLSPLSLRAGSEKMGDTHKVTDREREIAQLSSIQTS